MPLKIFENHKIKKSGIILREEWRKRCRWHECFCEWQCIVNEVDTLNGDSEDSYVKKLERFDPGNIYSEFLLRNIIVFHSTEVWTYTRSRFLPMNRFFYETIWSEICVIPQHDFDNAHKWSKVWNWDALSWLVPPSPGDKFLGKTFNVYLPGEPDLLAIITYINYTTFCIMMQQ